jgi:REP element-mobilizing transposase RayT
MKSGYIIRNQTAPHFLTFTVVDWIDIFSRKIYRDTIIESLTYCQQHKGLQLTAFVIMSNHIHLIARSQSGHLSDLVRDFKSYTATTILQQIKNTPESRAGWMLKRFAFAAKRNEKYSSSQFWQAGNHPEEIFSESFLWTKLNYIHMNPVRAGIVKKGSDYLYSSAANYVGKDVLIQVEIAANPILKSSNKQRWEVETELW